MRCSSVVSHRLVSNWLFTIWLLVTVKSVLSKRLEGIQLQVLLHPALAEENLVISGGSTGWMRLCREPVCAEVFGVSPDICSTGHCHGMADSMSQAPTPSQASPTFNLMYLN